MPHKVSSCFQGNAPEEEGKQLNCECPVMVSSTDLCRCTTARELIIFTARVPESSTGPLPCRCWNKKSRQCSHKNWEPLQAFLCFSVPQEQMELACLGGERGGSPESARQHCLSTGSSAQSRQPECPTRPFCGHRWRFCTRHAGTWTPPDLTVPPLSALQGSSHAVHCPADSHRQGC